AEVSYADPHVPSVVVDNTALKAVEARADALVAADCVLILTDHPEFDYRQVVALAPLVVDTRNATWGMPASLGDIVALCHGASRRAARSRTPSVSMWKSTSTPGSSRRVRTARGPGTRAAWKRAPIGCSPCWPPAVPGPPFSSWDRSRRLIRASSAR